MAQIPGNKMNSSYSTESSKPKYITRRFQKHRRPPNLPLMSAIYGMALAGSEEYERRCGPIVPGKSDSSIAGKNNRKMGMQMTNASSQITMTRAWSKCISAVLSPNTTIHSPSLHHFGIINQTVAANWLQSMQHPFATNRVRFRCFLCAWREGNIRDMSFIKKRH